MINWILIGIICLAAFFVFRLVAFRHGRHRFIMTVVLLIILILVSTFYFVSYKNNVDITSVNGFMTGAKLYGVWLISAFGNIKTLTGDAVKMDWASVNVSVNNSAAAANLGSNVTVNDVPASNNVNTATDSAPMPVASSAASAPSVASSASAPAAKPMVKPIIFNSS